MPSEDARLSSDKPRRGKLRPLLVGAGLGTVIAALMGIAATIWLWRNTLPIVTRADLEAAIQRWDKHGPASYNIDLKLGGKTPGTVHVEVRNHEVTAMTRDGVTPSQRRTWDYWSVPEQFETIRADFDSAEDPQRPFGAPAGSKVMMRAEFDPELGYPRNYQRQVLGTDLDVQWEVTRFEAIGETGK